MRGRLLLVFALALILRLGVSAALYTPDLKNFEDGDYVLYHVGAKEILQNQGLSNSLFLVRPPLFPLVVAAVGAQNPLVLLVDILLGALIAPLTMILARRLRLPDAAALLAGVLVAVDPSSVAYSAFLGPEPLANILLLLAAIALLAALDQTSHPRSMVYGAAAGGLLALSALTRPATATVWILLAVWLLITARPYWRTVAAFALACAIGIGGWIVHNGLVFNNTTVSTVSGYTLVYYRAASVKHIAEGGDMEQVYDSIGQQVEAYLAAAGDPSTDRDRTAYLAASPAITEALQSVAIDIFRQYPLVYLLTMPLSFARMYGLLPSSVSFTGPLAPLEIGWNALLLAGQFGGLWLAFRRRQWRLFWLVVIIAAFYAGGTMLVKSAGLNTREHLMLVPFMAVCCAYFATDLWEKRRQRHAAPVLQGSGDSG